MLDATARNNLGLDPANAISGSVPIHLSGRVATTADRDGRFAVEADLTSAQIDGFLPGWVKPAGKPARVTFTLNTKPQSIRIDDLVIEGAGNGVKGAVEFDGSGDLQSASFPSYGFSDGDRVSLKADRGPGRDAARHHARRSLRRPRLHQDFDRRQIDRQRSRPSVRPSMSISISRSALCSASTARR